MKKKTVKYTNEPLGKIKVMKDVLPNPENLIFKDETVQVTLPLSKTSIDFFKLEAKEHHTQYQKIIRALLDQYVTQYKHRHIIKKICYFNSL